MEQIQNAWDWTVRRWQVEDTLITADDDVSTMIIIGIIVATMLLTFTPLWRFLRQAGTIIHEMGHVLAAGLVGRKVKGIKLHTDTSGVTFSEGKPGGIGYLFTVLAGYPAPAFLGLMLSTIAYFGYAGASLTIYNIIIFLALLLCRNIIGFISCLIALISTGIISYINDPHIVSYTVVILAVFYGLSGIRGSYDLFRVHTGHWNATMRKDERKASREERKSSDAHQAYEITKIIPAPLWVGFFMVTTIAAFATTLYILLV